MYANQILKHLSRGNSSWRTDRYLTHLEFVKHYIQKSHQFFLGDYSKFDQQAKDRLENRKLFMGDLSHRLNLPYDSFLICYHGSNHQTRYAILAQRFCYDRETKTDMAISLNFLVSNNPKEWILTPVTRVYSIGSTISEALENNHFRDKVGLGSGTLPKHWRKANTSNLFIYSHLDNSPNMDNNIEDELGITDILKTLSASANYFLLLYNQKSIVTEVVNMCKPGRKMKRNNERVFRYQVLNIVLPKSGKKYRYDLRDTKSKGIIPFTDVSATWKTYTEDAPMFGNPKLVGDFYVPAHHRGSKQAGFAGKDYCIEFEN